MEACIEGEKVGELVARQPGVARVFEQLGIDYCCGGRQSVAEACAAKGLDLRRVVDALRSEQTKPPRQEQDWTKVALPLVVDHILGTHHAYLHRELPRLAAMIDKVARVHGGRHPEMLDIRSVFREFYTELDAHMMKEENILFPMIKTLESSQSAPHFHCGNVANPVHVMEMEHESAGAMLAEIRRLTNNYAPPDDACGTYRAMLHGLSELEADMHQHVHLENFVLFPRAIAVEEALS